MRRLGWAALLFPLLLFAQQADPTYTPAATATEGSLIARADVQLVAEGKIEDVAAADLPFTRYIWLPWGEPKSDEIRVKAQALTAGLAHISQASEFVRPNVVAGGRLLRVNLKNLCPNDKLPKYVEFWESLQFDPTFSVLITPDQVRLLNQISKELLEKINGQECSVACWDGADQRKRTTKRMKIAEAMKTAEADTLIRVNGHHLNAKAHVELQTATKSLAPIVDARYFVYRSLSAIQDDGVYRDVYGGLYYDLSGIRDMTKGSEKTDLDNFLAALGIKGGIKKLLEEGRADERAAMFRSNVTSRGRLVLWFSSPSTRRSVNTGLVMITRDLKTKRVDIGTHPVLNLDDFKHDATEVIFERPDGTLGYVLFDGEDKLQDEAPADVVVDRTVPEPHSPRLQPGISCIRCHGKKEAMGWQPMANDVKTLLRHVGVFGDVSVRGRPVAEVLDRLKGRYQGSPEKPLRLARDDLMAAMLRITGPWKAGDGDAADQTDITNRIARELAAIYAEAWYDPVGPKAAMRDLGFHVAEEKAAAYLTRLLPPVERSSGIYPEDARIAALRAGLSLNRFDWNMAFPFASARAQQTVLAMRQGKRLE